jgi:hypothetical protein
MKSTQKCRTTKTLTIITVLAGLMIGLGLMSVTSTTALSAETAPEVRLKAVEATFPSEVTIVEVGSYGPVSNSKPAARGERWMVVKATSDEGTNWGGFAVNRASVSDAAGKKYSVKAGSTGGNPDFYPQATSFMGNSDIAFFLFSIPANCKGLKFGVGGVEVAIPQSPPAATAEPASRS